MMNSVRPNERRANRISLQMPVRIEVYQTETFIWREMTHIIEVSPLGAGFYLKQRFPVGQLLFMTTPLPAALRCYDHLDPSYNVWGVIRHCNPLSVVDDSAFHVGVAFIGKQPPASFRENPLRIYRLTGQSGDRFYQITEDARPFYKPLPPRYRIPIAVSLAVTDAQGNVVAEEETVTENISRGGASVFSMLDVPVGGQIRFVNRQDNFSAAAVVRNRRVGADNLPRLHLEFIDAQLSLAGIE